MPFVLDRPDEPTVGTLVVLTALPDSAGRRSCRVRGWIRRDTRPADRRLRGAHGAALPRLFARGRIDPRRRPRRRRADALPLLDPDGVRRRLERFPPAASRPRCARVPASGRPAGREIHHTSAVLENIAYGERERAPLSRSERIVPAAQLYTVRDVDSGR
jgi:hypothetical protein